MNAWEVIAICIFTIVICSVLVLAVIHYCKWHNKKRELVDLSIEYYKRQNHEIQHTQDDL